MTKVGIIANPVSARDIRRIVSHAGNLTINDRANIVLRLLTGLAVGLAASGQTPAAQAFCWNKWLEVRVNERREIALVDVAVVSERFIGARAIWKTANFHDLFVTFGYPDAIGLSSIIGLLAPLDRQTPEGRRARLAPLKSAATRLAAPIAPGLIDEVGIGALETLVPDTVYRPEIAAGALALDGERELTFSEADEVSIRLTVDAFRSVNVSACMAYAARHGLLSRATPSSLYVA